MIAQQHYDPHSAQVKMRLTINGASFAITHMGWDYVLLQTPLDHPPGEASIFLKVDESKRQWKVRLPEGISKDSKRVALALSE